MDEQLIARIPVGKTALLDQELLGISFAPASRRRISFPGGEGSYTGTPATEKTIVEALSAVRASGPYFVVAWPAFWWQNMYTRFARCLHESERGLLDNDRLKIFAIESEISSAVIERMAKQGNLVKATAATCGGLLRKRENCSRLPNTIESRSLSGYSEDTNQPNGIARM